MTSPAKTTTGLGIAVGVLLVIVGVAAYVITDFASVTALIPALFGAVIAVLGVVGRRTGSERLAIAGMGVLAALGMLGSLRAVPDIVALVAGEQLESTVAVIAQGLTIALCLVLFVGVVWYVVETR